MDSAVASTVCEQCGRTLTFGDYPFCPHGRPLAYTPFKAWDDIALGCEITSLAQWNKVMRQKGAQMTDSMSKGAISARKDRCEAIRAENRRHR
jgi:hypothetical protein